MRRAGTAGALTAALVICGMAITSCGPPKISARPTSEGAFAYLFQTSGVTPDGSPAAQVRLAKIRTGLRPSLFGRWVSPTATDMKTLLDTGALSTPTQVHGLYASPLNKRLLVYSSEVPIGALDHNLQAWNMATGSGGVQFNEHTASNYVNKTTCQSAVFDKYVDDAYAGAPPAMKNALNFGLSVEGVDGANVPSPQILGWVDEERVAIRWKFSIKVTDGTILEDTFNLIVTWDPAGGAPPTMVCAPPPLIDAPETVLTADPVIKLRKKPVLFGKVQRKALRIAGNIAP